MTLGIYSEVLCHNSHNCIYVLKLITIYFSKKSMILFVCVSHATTMSNCSHHIYGIRSATRPSCIFLQHRIPFQCVVSPSPWTNNDPFHHLPYQVNLNATKISIIHDTTYHFLRSLAFSTATWLIVASASSMLSSSGCAQVVQGFWHSPNFWYVATYAYFIPYYSCTSATEFRARTLVPLPRLPRPPLLWIRYAYEQEQPFHK